MQFQGRADHDHRTARIVHALAEQVLPEPPLLALDHVGQGLERALVGAGDRAAAPAVVQQRVHGLLQHPLFVAHDDVRRVQFQQAAQPVVAVDHPPVEVVQVAGGEPPTVQGHQRPQVRRQHGQDGQDHPRWLISGIGEGFEQLQPFRQTLDLGRGPGGGNGIANAGHLRFQVKRQQQVADRLGAHPRIELVAVLLDGFQVGIVGEQLALFQVRHAGVHNHEGLEVENSLDLPQGHVEHQPDPRRQRLQKPDMRHGACKLDVRHALAAHLGLGDLHPAFLAHDAPVLQALVLAAKAFVILDGSEYLCAEQPVALRLECPVVDRLRLLDLAERP